jgi:hypothetical protein
MRAPKGATEPSNARRFPQSEKEGPLEGNFPKELDRQLELFTNQNENHPALFTNDRVASTIGATL